MNQIKKFIIIGYSLEACVIARKMAMAGREIAFIPSGKLGYPCDDINDFMNAASIKKIDALELDLYTDNISNGFHAHIPYEHLRMVNDKNGLISYPLNRTSFESAEEWEQIELRIHELDKFLHKLTDSLNYINIYKKFLPRWLFESLVKHVGTNKWQLKQSQFTKDALLREANMQYLGRKDAGVIYRPKTGYENLCKEILHHNNIQIKKQSPKNIKEIFRYRFKDSFVLFVDNRIDFICDYSMGKFDRVELKIEDVSEEEKSIMEEYSFIDQGAILTPLKEYWATSSFNGITKKIYSREISEIGKFDQNLIVPSQANLKTLNEYSKLFKRYPNKDFIIPAPLTILA